MSQGEIESVVPESKEGLLVELGHPTAEDLIPPPVSLLQGYEYLVPGTAERFLTAYMAFGERHREMQKQAQEAQYELARTELKLQGRGQIFGFVIAMAAILGGFLLATFGGQPTSGVLLSGGSLAAVVTALVTTRIVCGRQ